MSATQDLIVTFLLCVCCYLVGIVSGQTFAKNQLARGELSCEIVRGTRVCWNPQEEK